jgi:hypothetical protein
MECGVMADIADAQADRPLQPGDVVRVVGQELHWTVLRHVFEVALDDHFEWVPHNEPYAVEVWSDIHGREEFSPEVLERVR